jgi:hypothetical protein
LDARWVRLKIYFVRENKTCWYKWHFGLWQAKSKLSSIGVSSQTHLIVSWQTEWTINEFYFFSLMKTVHLNFSHFIFKMKRLAKIICFIIVGFVISFHILYGCDCRHCNVKKVKNPEPNPTFRCSSFFFLIFLRRSATHLLFLISSFSYAAHFLIFPHHSA